jgi:hypothetical protein
VFDDVDVDWLWRAFAACSVFSGDMYLYICMYV